MGLKDPRIGYNSATEFMASGLPWVTSSYALSGSAVTSFKFDKITKRLSVWNHETAAGKHLRVGFTVNGVNNGNYFLIDGGQTFEFDARIKEIFVRAHDSNDNPWYSLYAELIGIDSDMMPLLTGSVDGTTYWNGVG